MPPKQTKTSPPEDDSFVTMSTFFSVNGTAERVLQRDASTTTGQLQEFSPADSGRNKQKTEWSDQRYSKC